MDSTIVGGGESPNRGVPIVWVADIGSIAKDKFGWCRLSDDGSSTEGGSIDRMAAGLVADLSAGHPVALGFEAPMFVPVPEDSSLLLRARRGEGSRAWCAPAGATVTSTAIPEVSWILRQIKLGVPNGLLCTMDHESFLAGAAQLLLWEAFVSGSAKSATHVGDARIAANLFRDSCASGMMVTSVTCDQPFSLLGGAVLWAGLSVDVSLLRTECLVLRA